MLSLLERNEDIDCPGATISFMCSIQSNSEDLQLTWTVTPPGCPIFSANFMNSSTDAINDECTGVIVSLTNYSSGVGLESVLTIQSNISLNGTAIECGIGDLGNEMVTLFINTSGIMTNLKLL